MAPVPRPPLFPTARLLSTEERPSYALGLEALVTPAES